MSKIGGFLALFPLFFCSCTLIEDYEARKAARAEQERLAALKAETDLLHQAFREQSGWKKKTYENETVLAMVTPENARMQVSLADQRGILMVDDLIAVDFPIASGKRSHPTPTGSYTILDKKKKYNSNLYGRVYDAEGNVVNSDADSRSSSVPEGGRFVGASMPYWMRLTNTGVGLHVGYVPGGRPASHGCIRMPRKVAPKIYERVKLGTPVMVVEQGPVSWDEYQTIEKMAEAASSSRES